ncbi:unnamed protein product [Cylicostephanus goldi]|uniref:Clathrin light chain n=1 Tax=Cylicostephanus goldi TaxID=71465 RepID=A0A3P6QD62_CYLGO|nr:unnamed protein product [Cylicostephanus goldi]
MYQILAAAEPPPAPAADEIAALIDPPSVGGGDSGVDLAGMDYQPTPPGMQTCLFSFFIADHLNNATLTYPMNDFECGSTYLLLVPLVNGNGVNSHQSAASSKGPSPVPVPRIEAENIRRWREQQKVLLEKKDEAEEKKKNELRAAAKKELEDWYKQREAALKLTKEANRCGLKTFEANHILIVLPL